MKSTYDKIVEAAALVDKDYWVYSCNAIAEVGLSKIAYLNWLLDCGGELCKNSYVI